MSAIDPSSEYRRRLGERRASLEQWAGVEQVLLAGPPALVVLLFVSLWAVFIPHLFSGWFILLLPLAYVAIELYDNKLSKMKRRAIRAVAFYERGLARLEDRWMGGGNCSASFADEHHLYVADLDIFGKGSLFDLLCTARTRCGEETLARWLCAPASRGEIEARQEAVRELRDHIDLREELVAGGPVAEDVVHSEFISEWAEAPAQLGSGIARLVAPLLVLFTLASALWWWRFGGPQGLLMLAAAAQVGFALHYRERVRSVIASADELATEFDVAQSALARLERETFASVRLRELQGRLQLAGKRPSEEIASLLVLIEMLRQRVNSPAAVIAPLLLWATQLAFAIEAWRRRCGPMVGTWLQAAGEVEALCALAAYTFEHQDHPFPELVDGEAFFEGTEMRHPLLPRSQCVANSVRLGDDLRLFVISGSNMSGKSTLLRTLGINLVLAQAGAPACATRLRSSLFAVGATLRVQDSLQGGASRFYAEIRRLNDIMELTRGKLPVLFLLDEILNGTNSHDRAIGAEAVISGLVDGGAVGLVTTHDLALSKVADSLSPRAANVHFQDHLENGRIAFDYQLHEGVVQKSNALELMRAVGLRV